MATSGQIKTLDSDIACFQEMGNYDDFFREELDKMGYSTFYYANKNKQHGCCIAFKKKKFVVLDSLNIELDDTENESYGSIYCPKSTLTGNIGVILALKPVAAVFSEDCLIIGTCHLYWRPDCDYERLRQAHLFSRASVKFSQKFTNSSVLICGDFNSQPHHLNYKALVHFKPFDESLLVKTVAELNEFFKRANDDLLNVRTLLDGKLTELAELPIVNDVQESDKEVSILVSKKKDAPKKLSPQEILDKEVKRLEREIRRLEEQVDLESKLMSVSDLYNHVQTHPRLSSIYQTYASIDESYLSYVWGDCPAPIFEPKFTHFKDFIKTTLDYIFLIEESARLLPSHVLALPDPSHFGEGLPNAIHPSDHLPIMGVFVPKE